MLSKNQIKYINSLKISKYRNEENVFVAEGIKLVDEILHSRFEISQIFVTQEWVNENSVQNKYQNCIQIITEEELKKISSLTTPNQVLAVVKTPEYQISDNIFEQLTLILDDIRDPGNMGTIIRIADWFGIPNIICSLHSVDCYNPKVVQATMGSIARVNIFYTDLLELLKQKPQNFSVYGTLLEGENIYGTDLETKGFIVIGNESKGISNEVKNHLTHALHIPSFNPHAADHAESLNASVAAAIVCSEFKRR